MDNKFAHRLKEAMNIRGLKAVDLCQRTNIHKSALSQYLSGKFVPKQGRLWEIAKALNVSEVWLMGYDVPMEAENDYENVPAYGYGGIGKSSLLKEIRQIETKRFPMLGNVACGKPIFANEEYETYIEASSNINADFCLTAKGDSMINARIFDGDIVFIRSQSDVNNGEIAVVIIEEEVTLKRVYKYNNRIELRAENPTYPPMNFENEELEKIHILGKAVAFQSYVK